MATAHPQNHSKPPKRPSLWRSLLLPPPKEVKKPSFWQSSVLLFFIVVIFSVVGMLWLKSQHQDSEIAQSIRYKASQDSNTRFSEITTLDDVGIFERQVNKVSFENVVRQIHSEHPEFKDAEYAVKYNHAWTIQIMDVSKEEVILDYLATHEKRKQFSYFRMSDDTGNKRYVLTFDNFNDEAGALKAIGENEFKLPASITPFVIPFKKYIGKIDDYHLRSQVRDYSRSNPRRVRLYKTAAPVIRQHNRAYTGDAEKFSSYYERQAKKDFTPKTTKPKANAFAAQPKPTGRVIQPKVATTKNRDNVKIIDKTDVKAKPKPKPSPQPKSKPSPQPKLEPKPETKNLENGKKPQAKPEIDSKSETKPVPKAQVKPEPHNVESPKSQAEPKPKTKPESKSESNSQKPKQATTSSNDDSISELIDEMD